MNSAGSGVNLFSPQTSTSCFICRYRYLLELDNGLLHVAEQRRWRMDGQMGMDREMNSRRCQGY